VLEDFAALLSRDRLFRVAAVAAAVNLTTSVNIALAVYNDYLSFAVYWIEIAAISLAFGAATGMLALAMSAACVLFFFIPPVFSFRILSALDGRHFAEFAGVGLIAWLLAVAGRRLGRGPGMDRMPS
jgi:K+-sensing histidine kinase KdpD